MIIGKLDHYKNKFCLTIISILCYTRCGIQNCLVPKNMTRINGLAGAFTPLYGWPHLPNNSVFLSLRLWFQKLKTTRLREYKSFSVCFGKSKCHKIHVGGFWGELLISQEWAFWAFTVSILNSMTLNQLSVSSLFSLCIAYILKYTLCFPIFLFIPFTLENTLS